MTTLVHPGQRGLLPDLFDWLENPLAAIRPSSQMIRFEEFRRNGQYVLRAELPGIDPDSDVKITISGGILTIHGERKEEEKERFRTEFRYGSFTRAITLPSGADEHAVKAVYDQGILEVTIGLKEPTETAQHIKIEKKE
jgi:HSP20 family protein